MNKEKYKQIVWKLTRKLGFGWLVISFYPKSILVHDGWFVSYHKDIPIDSSGNYLPWLTYPFIDFITPRLKRNFSLFEYGCGYSTIWYCGNVKNVLAVENNANWASKISNLLPENGKIFIYENSEDYVNSIDVFDKFDIIVVDGVERSKCYIKAIDHLYEDGIIIADNSDREDFKESWPILQSRGFKEISFCGLAPSHFVKSQTSILYRNENCLGI